MPTELLMARIVLIYKKGDTNLCENYRPISLLNTMYKIFAAAIQRRKEYGVDKHLQDTQYGFRKNRGTQEALYNIRRVITAGESSQNKTYLLLLGWAKAFDKVDQEKMVEAMGRLGLPDKMLRILTSFYRNPQFRVKAREGKSTYHHIYLSAL